MATSAIAVPAFIPLRARSISRGTFFYSFCLGSITLGYYLYWLTGKLKFFYAGWAASLLLLGLMAAKADLNLSGLSRGFAPVAAWFVYLAVSATWAPAPKTSLFLLAVALINPVAFIISYGWARATSLWMLSFFFELQVLLIVPLAIWYLWTTGRPYDASFGAARSEFALRCVVSIPFLVWRARSRPTARTIGVLLATLLLILSLDSRSALVVTPMVLFGSLMSIKGSIGRFAVSRTSLILSVIGLLALCLALPPVREKASRSLSRFGPAETSFSVTSNLYSEVDQPGDARVDIERRLQLFVAFESFISNPMFGGGYQSTYEIIQQRFGWEVSAHGLPSTLAGESGLVGTVVFSFVIVSFFRRIRPRLRTAESEIERGFFKACIWTMVALLLFGLFHQVDQEQSIFVLLAWGFALGTPGRLRPAKAPA